MAAKGKTVVLRAKWDANPYTVKFNGNAPSGVSGLSGNINCVYDKQFTLPNAPSREGWTFGGWYKNAACTEDQKLGNAGATFSNLTANANETVTLYARWIANSYTVTFDSNGGGSVGNKTVIYNSQYGNLPTPYKANHKFVGWYIGSTRITADTIVTNAKHHTLIARWTKSYVSWEKSYGSDGINVDDGGLAGIEPLGVNVNTGFKREELIAAGCTELYIEITMRADRYSLINFRNNPYVSCLGQNVNFDRVGEDPVTQTRAICVPISRLSETIQFVFNTSEGDAYTIYSIKINITAR